MNIRHVNCGIVGFGTVGSATAKILRKEKTRIKALTGIDYHIKRIAEVKPVKEIKTELGKDLFTKDYKTLVTDPEIDIILELIGGTTTACEVITTALENKKHVVTANKALLAEKGSDLFGLAQKNNRLIGFEAAVCGGIPVIRALKEGLVGNQIKSIFGILNGTANFILSKMRFEGKDFNTALKEAQDLGFAEQDPTFDIEGIDSAHKISILASLAFGKFYHYKKVYVEGITDISALDIRYADEMGYIVKLLAATRMTKKGVPFLSVAPALIPKDEIIAEVNYEYNGVFIEGDSVDHTLYTGKGAGGMPTGSAVVSDLVHIAAYGDLEKDQYTMYPAGTEGEVLPVGEYETEYYLRLKVADKPGVMSRISGIFGDQGISIAGLMQKQNTPDGDAIVVIKTHQTITKSLFKAVDKLNNLDIVDGKVIKIRIINDLYN
jgi:homoserine dehydrogenase